MRSPLIVHAAALVALCTGAAPLHAQETDEVARAIGSVMTYRLAELDDPIPFDACRIQRVTGDAEDVAARLHDSVRSMLDGPLTGCPRQAAPQSRSVVLVDSVRLSPEGDRVFVTVLRGEYRHREDYTFHPANSSTVFLLVREVRLWGHGQAYGGWRSYESDPR